VDAYIDPQSSLVKGDPERAEGQFNLLCATCHGTDGKSLATGSDVGDVARENPWEALHKLRNGHPDEAMPALQVLDMRMLVDMLAYAQTLP
jgi:mono/diheme cytochrome c family protein